MRGGKNNWPRKSESWVPRGGRQRVRYVKRVEQLAGPFSLPWLPLDWAESEPEEDTVQTIRVNALEQMDQYL